MIRFSVFCGFFRFSPSFWFFVTGDREQEGQGGERVVRESYTHCSSHGSARGRFGLVLRFVRLFFKVHLRQIIDSHFEDLDRSGETDRRIDLSLICKICMIELMLPGGNREICVVHIV